ncbi:MAG TPA: hypothetical protein DD633_00565 [Sphaerochaeta sp.]|nr:hypothetical protein [Sphaerochaeta sp.]
MELYANFVENLEGKALFSSSAVFEQVADGSCKVGITYEEAALKYEKSGENLEVVYPAEGTSKVPGPIAIIKGAKNLEHAKKFVDFILSKEVQAMMGGHLSQDRSYRYRAAVPHGSQRKVG